MGWQEIKAKAVSNPPPPPLTAPDVAGQIAELAVAPSSRTVHVQNVGLQTYMVDEPVATITVPVLLPLEVAAFYTIGCRIHLHDLTSSPAPAGTWYLVSVQVGSSVQLVYKVQAGPEMPDTDSPHPHRGVWDIRSIESEQPQTYGPDETITVAVSKTDATGTPVNLVGEVLDLYVTAERIHYVTVDGVPV